MLLLLYDIWSTTVYCRHQKHSAPLLRMNAPKIAPYADRFVITICNPEQEDIDVLTKLSNNDVCKLLSVG